MELRRNLIANYLGQGWVALMILAFVPLYIRYLGIEAYGLIGFFAILQAWLGLLDMGMTPTLSREMARFTAGAHAAESIRDLVRSIEIIALGIAILIAGCAAFSAQWIAASWLKTEALSTEAVTQAFVMMGLIIALRLVEGIYRSAIIGLQRQVLLNAVISLVATLRSLGSIGIIVWVSPTIQSFFLWQGALSIFSLAALGISAYASLPQCSRNGRFSMNSLQGVWRFAGGMVGITSLALLLNQVDKILLSKLLPLVEFGYYTLASTAAISLYALISPITQAFYPKFCELHARGDTLALAEAYHEGAQLVSVTVGSVAIILILFAETILRLWTQDPALADRVAPLLRLLALGNLFNGLMFIPYHVQLAHGWTRLTVYVNVAAVSLIVPAILWVVPRYGTEGAAWIWVVLNTGYVLIAINFMYRRIMTGERWRWYWQDVLKPLAMALMAAGAVKAMFPAPNSILMQIIMPALGAMSAVCAGILASRRFNIYFIKILKQLFVKIMASPSSK